MRSIVLVPVVGLMVCLTMCSCLKTLMGKPTYDPSTYGTAALLDTVRSGQSSASDAEAAAQELGKRKLSEADGYALIGALKGQQHRKARVAILQTITTHKMTFLFKDLAVYSLKVPDAETGVEAAMAVVALAPGADTVLAYSKAMLVKAQFAEVRARAARLIVTSFADNAEPLFIKAVENEKSASAATFMCEYLAQKGSAESADILNRIANDVNRIYETDSYLGTKTTSETVRGAAVRGSERFR